MRLLCPDTRRLLLCASLVMSYVVFAPIGEMYGQGDLLDDFDNAFAAPVDNRNATPVQPLESEAVREKLEIENPDSEVRDPQSGEPVIDADERRPIEPNESVKPDVERNAPIADTRIGYRLMIETPINYAESIEVRNALDQLANQVKDGQIELLVEFRNRQASDGGAIGVDSEFEPCLSIARLFTGAKGGRFNTIAYVDPSLHGHATLVAMSCQNLIVAPTVEFGAAATGEAAVDDSIVQSYKQIAKMRGRIPEAAVDSMLRPEQQLYRVTLTDQSEQFVTEEDVKELRRLGNVLREEHVTIANQLAVFTGAQLRDWKWIDLAAKSEEEVREYCHLDRVNSISGITIAENPVPVLFELSGDIDQVMINRCIRVFRESNGMTLAIVVINSDGGSLEQSTRLATYLTELNSAGVQTVALIDNRASGDAALIAMACQAVYAIDGATFGGDGVEQILTEDLIQLAPTWKGLATATNKDAVQFYGTVSSKLELREYISESGQVMLAAPQIVEADREIARQWKLNDQSKPIYNINLDDALARSWITDKIESRESLPAKLNLDSLPPASRVSKLEAIATSLASSKLLAFVLIIVGFKTFTTELMAPGSTIFLFISLMCFTLFFWLQFLNGTLESLEVILFVVGLVFLGLEFFLLPGFGIFGIGGAILCLAGLLLATQTFVLPSTNTQWNQFAWNLLGLSIASLVSLLLFLAVSDQLQKSPIFRLLELKPPTPQTSPVAELTAQATDLNSLIGQTGKAVTTCAPYGRAMIAGRTREVFVEDAFIAVGSAVKVVKIKGDLLQVEQI